MVVSPQNKWYFVKEWTGSELQSKWQSMARTGSGSCSLDTNGASLEQVRVHLDPSFVPGQRRSRNLRGGRSQAQGLSPLDSGNCWISLAVPLRRNGWRRYGEKPHQRLTVSVGHVSVRCKNHARTGFCEGHVVFHKFPGMEGPP